MRPPEQSASRISPESEAARSTAESLLGDFAALVRQLGVAEILPDCEGPVASGANGVANASALKEFLQGYLTQILLPLELPAIAEACQLSRRGQLRELISLDQQVAAQTRPVPFASASRKVGALQLRRMRPLRDERVVQRYLNAVESGEATGWHALVFGLTMAVYSIPLREGLLHYGRETISVLARASVGIAALDEPGCQEILAAILSRLPEAVDRTVPPGEVVMVPLRRCW